MQNPNICCHLRISESSRCNVTKPEAYFIIVDICRVEATHMTGPVTTWWRHQMETVSVLLATFAGNSPVTGKLPAQMPVTLSFDVFFDLRLNKRLSKQSWGWLFETPWRPQWRHCNDSSSDGLVYIDGLVQGRRNPSALAMTLRLSCTIMGTNAIITVAADIKHLTVLGHQQTQRRVHGIFPAWTNNDFDKYLLLRCHFSTWLTRSHKILQATLRVFISTLSHDDVIKWKHFPRYWTFVRRIHRWPMNCPHKGQWRGALVFSLMCAWINGWVNNGEAGDLRRTPSRPLCRELVCITVKWTWYNGRDNFFYITSGRINTRKGVNQLKELFF